MSTRVRNGLRTSVVTVALPVGGNVACRRGAERLLRLGDAARVVTAGARVGDLALLQLCLRSVQIAARNGALHRVTPEAGGEVVEGRMMGTLMAADGLMVFVEPRGRPGQRFSCHYHHIASIERK